MTAKTALKILFPLFVAALVCCGGGSSPSNPEDGGDLDPAPNFTPSGDDELDALVVNTFADAGIDITVTPDTIDFNEEDEIEKDDEVTRSFTVTNNSGAARTFAFKFYAVSSGFSLLDESEINLGSWDAVTLEDGESATLNARFNAWVFGTQTTYLTITADIDGYIRLPMRAAVSGASDFRVIPTGHACSDDDAPAAKHLDFKKVAFERTETRGIKICNTGGEDFKVYETQILPATSSLKSSAMDDDAFAEFIWEVEDEIEASYSLGLEPAFAKTFSEPQFIAYGATVETPEADYAAVINETGAAVEDVTVAAGGLLRLDVNLSPSLDIEAPEGQLYEPVALNAKLRVRTSLGIVDIPLLGATGGKEPVLKLSYRAADSEIWREIDLDSDGTAAYFGTVGVFRDWVTDNYQSVEFKVENAGSGSKDLEFYPQSLAGYFEYDALEGANPQFPIAIASGGGAQSFAIRYLPTPDSLSEEARWDFGQFYFEHTGGNGPLGKMALVGQRESGYAVQLKFGGTELEREYADSESKNLCVMQIDDGASAATQHAFTVVNNSKENALTVNWSLAQDADSEAAFSASPPSGQLTVAPDSSESFTVELLADSATAEGASIKGTLNVTTAYPAEVESEYAAALASLEGRDFAVPVQFQASSTGECTLGGGKVIGKDAGGKIEATILIDRITMIMTSLIEAARNHPKFKYHLPVEIDHENGRIRISQEVPFIYDKDAPEFSPIHQFRSFAHQITNINGCPPLPSNPYRLEFEKGSWTADGYQCNGDGSLSYTGKDGTTTIDTDTACMPSNGGEEVEVDGVKWVVFYHDFVKFDTSGCEMEYYGKIATFAYRPDVEDFGDVFKRSEESPNAGEEEYEDIYGAYQFGSYIFFNKDGFKCGDKTYSKGSMEEDPDAVKDCYTALAERDDNTRQDGFLNECAYFNFVIDEGVEPSDAYSENPNTEAWTGYGTYEPYVDADGKVYDTKYDITLYNVHAQVFALSAGDRFSFFRHPGHLLYSELYVTFTTKAAADENDPDNWNDLIAVNSRPNFDKDEVFLTNGDPYELAKFWTDDGISNEFSNVVDDAAMESGVDYGGAGKGAFRNCAQGSCDIVPSGWPVNFDENNLMLIVGLGSFNGKGNTAPSFAKEDSSGKGKALYFSLHGCLIEGTPSDLQGCYSYKLDSAKMDHNDDTGDDDVNVVELYKEYGILPEGYPGDSSGGDASDCANFESLPENDPGAPEFDPYKYMACINYKMFPVDRNRFVNYYDSDKFYYSEDEYGSSTCGYGM